MAEIGRLGDYNCRHNKYPIDEFQKPIHDDKDLREKEQRERETRNYKGVEYTPYEATQRMREMEREMRALRLEGKTYMTQYRMLRKKATAAELEEMKNPFSTMRLRYRALRAEYEDFANFMGLKTQFERVTYDMLGKVF